MNAAPQRPERLPHPAAVNRELDRLRSLTDRLRVLSEELGNLYAEAYEAALSPRSNGEGPATLGRGHAHTDPTGTTATNAQLRQLRWRASKASGALARAIASTEEGLALLGDGFLHLDDVEWSRWIAKRLAAEGR